MIHEIKGFKFSMDEDPCYWIELRENTNSSLKGLDGLFLYAGRMECKCTATEVRKALVGEELRGQIIKGIEMFAVENQSFRDVGFGMSGMCPQPLEKKMKKYETKNRERCKGCGNPWFFDGPTWWECTTCGKVHGKKQDERRKD